MPDHEGQPMIPNFLTFDVDSLVVTETGLAPVTILDPAKPFTLTVTFTGAGTWWTDTMPTVPGARYHVHFYAERLGFGGMDLAAVEGPLALGQLTYTVPHTVPANTLSEGLYRLGVAVTFPRTAGVAGYYEGLIIQAAPRV
jgi:hypothetical protein